MPLIAAISAHLGSARLSLNEKAVFPSFTFAITLLFLRCICLSSALRLVFLFKNISKPNFDTFTVFCQEHFSFFFALSGHREHFFNLPCYLSHSESGRMIIFLVYHLKQNHLGTAVLACAYEGVVYLVRQAVVDDTYESCLGKLLPDTKGKLAESRTDIVKLLGADIIKLNLAERHVYPAVVRRAENENRINLRLL